jgi:integrase
MRMKLTVTSVRSLELPSGKPEAIHFDDDLPGFGIRLRGKSRTWIFQYKIAGLNRRITLGSADVMTLKSALEGERDADGNITRHGAKDLHALVRLGHDPAQDKVERVNRARDTFGALVDKYLKAQERELRPRSFIEVKRHLEKYAKPLHRLALIAVNRRVIAELINTVAEESGDVTANRVRSTTSAMFSWAMEQGLAETNPVIGTAKREEKSRDRVLLPAEMRAIWRALVDDDYSNIIRLLGLTGQRAAEIAWLSRREITANRDAIELPEDRTKNGRKHIVPLAAPARAIIESLPQRCRADGTLRDLLFGIGKGGFSGWSKGKEALDTRVEKANGAPLAHWTPHDWRRSMSTYMAGGLDEHQLAKLPVVDRELATGLGVQPHVIEAVLNHVSGHKGGVAGIYNRSDYAREKRQALDLWADRLMAIVQGRSTNVLPLRAV